jgi:hypothetical protein
MGKTLTGAKLFQDVCPFGIFHMTYNKRPLDRHLRPEGRAPSLRRL